ncbi:hypothetical protein GJAV_G00160490 [Gymnothorax javanicus]|nr:hypothetical protein GJAV_G00160490 [Gymnothorax javanicus]
MSAKVIKPEPLKTILIKAEGATECKELPACSEEHYFQIHTSIDSEGKGSKSIHFYAVLNTQYLQMDLSQTSAWTMRWTRWC